MTCKAHLFLFLTVSFLSSQSQNIHRTACSGDMTRLDSMLQHNDLHVLDERGRTLMHWAVGCNQHEVFDELVSRGMDLNRKDSEGNTALYVAIQFDRDTLFDQYLSMLKDGEWAMDQGAGLLQRAILDGKLSYVQKLIENGVDIETANALGSTPLEMAKRVENEEIYEWLISKGANESKIRTFSAKGAYLGEPLPDTKKRVFARNFISTEEYEYGSVFNASGTEFYYAIAKPDYAIIRYSKLEGDTWSQPVTILEDEKYGYNDPFLSPDEQRLYFISKRTLDGTDIKDDHDIWYVEKTEDGSWSEPINAGPNINSEHNEYYISFTKEGTMYFASNVNAPEDRKRSDQDIYYSTFENGEFQEPVRLGDAINTENYEADVFIDPDETYLIFCSTRPDGLGRGDLYISFKDENDEWTEAVNMGEAINSKHHELCPFVTSDGKFLFYTSDQDIYWVSMEILEDYR